MAKTLSLRSTKEAALYFDHVMPFDGVTAARLNSKVDDVAWSECVPYDNGSLAEKVVGSLLGAKEVRAKMAMLLSLQWALLHIGTVAMGHEDPSDDPFLKSMCNLHGINLSHDDFRKDGVAGKVIKESVSKFLSDSGFGDCSTWSSEPLIDTPVDRGGGGFEAIISGLKLVDVSKVSWESIIEFRRDEESGKALRELRLFFQENYADKGKAYVEDKLMSLLDKQESAARLWGFETAQKSLGVAFSNQSALIGSISGLAATFGGMPLTAAAGAALVVPFANCALEFFKIVIDSKKQIVDRPTKFMTKLKELGKS